MLKKGAVLLYAKQYGTADTQSKDGPAHVSAPVSFTLSFAANIAI